MKLVTVEHDGQEQAAFLTDHGVIPLTQLNEEANTHWDTDLFTLLQNKQLKNLRDWYASGGQEILSALPALSVDYVSHRVLYRQPGKMIGVGMNYLAKAIELSGRPPEDDPVIFLKPDTSLIGSGEAIRLPDGAGQVTAEAELAIVIGQTCRNVSEDDAMNYVAGYTTSLDMTAKEIHARNPRFLQRAKSFDTFLSLGSSLSTPDEYIDLPNLKVETVLNGEVIHHNTVSQMIFSPAHLISFLSHVMTLHPGDIILTGTPGSVVIDAGDEVECRIAGLKTLSNSVEN
ncbi:2-keto-4-pentenoate hydratase/2-oxohepta-3-ene-1,7-dioic acid hydratase in catechol pathway [Paenibacillus amylolyticus]|uniref:2-keto-4-pentenoate hydratase/2-oxohepta-3-ene-1,7-dioic acid hydratase in catechol pathway n=1 Tax=Paenibacillus amylolyticus TaxID=1451 RepID=A0AAP5LRD0_PAEAM|nr:fumarylacetoacetate hydrolase family protein [Paenibacillus amylolyticus]MDR6726560.1 2-keto-4-pentenoate hydratase/2-oxohepta-3-ene-1,7-dioic acid hydratase in catechol pathway [Paenibacillus amylolyticus]